MLEWVQRAVVCMRALPGCRWFDLTTQIPDALLTGIVLIVAKLIQLKSQLTPGKAVLGTTSEGSDRKLITRLSL